MKRILGTSPTSVMQRVVLYDSSSTVGAILAALAYNTASLAISIAADASAGADALTIEDITTIGTYQAPTSAAHVRFKAVDGTDMTGAYELHFHNDTLAAKTGAIVKISGAANLAPCFMELQMGPVAANLIQIMGAAIAGTAADIAASFGTFFNTNAATATVANITSVLGKFTGITALAQWLGAMAAKHTPNATALAEINATGAGLGTFDATTDSGEGVRGQVDETYVSANSAAAEAVTAAASAAAAEAAATATPAAVWAFDIGGATAMVRLNHTSYIRDTLGCPRFDPTLDWTAGNPMFDCTSTGNMSQYTLIRLYSMDERYLDAGWTLIATWNGSVWAKDAGFVTMPTMTKKLYLQVQATAGAAAQDLTFTPHATGINAEVPFTVHIPAILAGKSVLAYFDKDGWPIDYVGDYMMQPIAAASAPTANENADAVLARDLGSGTGAGTLDERTVRSALRFIRNKWGVSGSTLTVKKEDDVTTAWTAEVTTDANGVPITGNDPT